MMAETLLRIRDTPQGVVFEVRVHPRAKRTALTGILDGHLRVALASPPVDGRANDELQRFFASVFDVSRSAVQLVAGEHARDKRVLVAGRDSAAIVSMVDRALPATEPPTS